MESGSVLVRVSIRKRALFSSGITPLLPSLRRGGLVALAALMGVWIGGISDAGSS